MKKPRSDAKLLTLPDDQQLRIFEWLKVYGYDVTKEMIASAEDINITTSVGALHNFWQHWIARESENRILRAVSASDSILDNMAGHSAKLEAATEAALKQATFEAVLSGADPKAIKVFSDILLKNRQLDQSEQVLELRVREFEQKIADVQDSLSKAKKDGGLDVETIEKIEQQLGLL